MHGGLRCGCIEHDELHVDEQPDSCANFDTYEGADEGAYDGADEGAYEGAYAALFC